MGLGSSRSTQATTPKKGEMIEIGGNGGKKMRVVYEDEAMVVVDKPANVLSVPGRAPDVEQETTTRRKRAREYFCEAAKKIGVSEKSLPRDRLKFARFAVRKGMCAHEAEADVLWREIDAAAKSAESGDHGEADSSTALGAARIARAVSLRPVHRLDFETSGLLVFAKTKDSAAGLCRAFRRDAPLRKSYVAVVNGRLSGDRGEWTWPILKAGTNPPRYACAPDGKPSRTRWTVLSYDAALDATRLELEPVTGRSHQLRVHCLTAGHPILGDPIYFDDHSSRTTPHDRLYLHAACLRFQHPLGGGSSSPLLDLRAPVPF